MADVTFTIPDGVLDRVREALCVHFNYTGDSGDTTAKNQFMKAIVGAESYQGPSLIIAYAPCINHGMNMGRSQHEEKRAVESGYWSLYRFDPRRKEEGENPFILDSKEPKEDFREFLMGEVRYASLTRTFPDNAEALFKKAEEDMKERYETYRRMAGQEN